LSEPPKDLIVFCEAQHRRLVGLLALYCGDLDVAEELAQETLARVCRDWKRVRSLDSPEAWTNRVGINLAHSHFRRRSAERRALKRMEAQHAREQVSSWPSERSDLLDAIARLPHRQRSAILLRYYLRLRVKEVAEVLDCPEGTAKTLIHRGVRALGSDLDIGDSKEASDAV
jgi:RNA polymerase sigma factor (sigma-70 family)